MAITVKGVDATFQLTHFAELQEARALVSPRPDGVLSGFGVAVSTGNRLLSVAAGSATLPGALIESSAAETVTLDANTSGSPRIDLVVAEVDWSGSSTTAGDVKFVKGTPGASPVAPTLTRTEGVVWQLPLAEVLVANGATQLVAGNVTPLYPQADTGYVQLSLPGTYTHGSPSLAVCRTSGVTEFGGSFYRSSNIAASAQVDLGVVIPRGFRPRRTAEVEGTANRNGAPKSVVLIVGTDGSVSVQNTSTSTITAGERIRPNTITWLSEV